MKTILYIAPHLSTGGLPQYLAKKIELLKDTYEIYVIEYNDFTGGHLVIQRNKILNLIDKNLITLDDNKASLLNFITVINPEIIHMEELPEYFMSDEIAKEIYRTDRTYKIFETCHDSSFNTSDKKYQPDKFILVSNFQVDMLKSLNIESEVVEYPIEFKERPNRSEALLKLGLDPSYKHVLHVGLYTNRKNQKEFFEFARQYENKKIIFHSIGNRADNFKDYWEPLSQNTPSNLMWYGEKSNVDDYYSAMDLFLFTSKGTINDKETMPLVIREAISWNLPTLIYNLPVYQDYFNQYPIVDYLSFDSFDDNIVKINNKLFSDEEKTIIIISSYPTTKSSVILTQEAIQIIKNQGYDVILTSHAIIPNELQSEVDYAVFNSNNILTHHDFYCNYTYENQYVGVKLNLTTENNHIYHGAAVYTNYYNGIALAKSLGYDNAICINYDMLIHDETVIPRLINDLKKNDAVFNRTIVQEGNILRTVLFGVKTDFFLNHFKVINNENDYNNWKLDVGSESNGLENIFYHNLKHQLASIKLLTDIEFYSMLGKCKIDLCSMVEYFSVLSVKNEPHKFCVWYNTSNESDDREVMIDIKGYRGDGFEKLLIKKSEIYYNAVIYEGGSYDISLIENGVTKKNIRVDANYMKNIKNNGEITFKEI